MVGAQVQTSESSRLPSLGLDELLGELQARLQAVLATRDRVNALFDAVVAIGTNLDIEVVLRGIVESAVSLVNARYGAMGVIGDRDRLAEFIPVGLTEEEIRRIHHWPEGRGLLGALIRDPRPVRLADLSTHELSSGFPAGHPPMTSFLGVPIRIRGEVYGNLYLTEKAGGGEFDEEDQAVLVALAAAAGVAIENARLYDEARRQQRWLAAIADVTRMLLSGADVRDALELITTSALEMSGADLVMLALPAGGGGELEIAHAVGEGAHDAVGVLVPGNSASGRVLASGQVLVIQDYSHDNRVAAATRERLSLGPAVLVPLGAAGNVRGVLTAGRRPGAMPLAGAATDMLVTFASQAGIALELAEHRRQAERVAVFEDRDRIARDLHDLVIQRLYATGISLQGAVGLIDAPDVAGRIGQAVDALDETIREIRTSIFELQARPRAATAPGLRSRIVEVADEMTGLLGFAPTLELEGPLDNGVPADAAEHLLGVLREALSNAARHAAASTVEVRVRAAADDLSVTVTDNGTGIRPGRRRSGLANLARRAEECGGSLRVGTPDGGGTRLEWLVPMPTAPSRGSAEPAVTA